MSYDSKYPLELLKGNEDYLVYRNPYFVPSLILGYILFSTWIGPAFMKNRKPFGLQKILVTYNLIEVLLNGYITYWDISIAIANNYMHCLPRYHPITLTSVEKTIPLYNLLFFNKTLELLDTVFFVLRKKNHKVSLFQVSHHSIMCFLFWFGMRNMAQNRTYHFFIPLAINTGVHTVMYTYYSLAVMGSGMARYQCWKSLLRVLQIAQFVLVPLYFLIEIVNGCLKMNKIESVICIMPLFLLCLFLNITKKYKRS